MMADSRVHPAATADTSPSPPSFSFLTASSKQSTDDPAPSAPPPPSKPSHPPSTYVIQFPKEQILRYPPPGNEKKFKNLTRRKTRRSCCFYALCLFLLLAVAAFISTGVLYLVFRFKSPKYSVTRLPIKGMNLTSSAPISPEFDITIRAENPNEKVGIFYPNDMVVSISYNESELSEGILPTFSQPKKKVTVLETALTGTDVVLGRTVRTALMKSQSEETVPFVVRVKGPVKIKVGSIMTWQFTVQIKCDVVMDALNETANVVSQDCDSRVRLW